MYLPPIFGGPLLSALADLLPSRAVLIVSDVLRVVLVGVMAVPAMPVWALDVLLTIVTLADLPYSAGRAELGPTVLPDELWQLGGAITATAVQFCQIAGFVAGVFTRLLPEGSRGTAFGFASSGVLAAQGLGLIAGGGIAEAIGPQLAVGLAGVLAAAMITLGGRAVINSMLLVIHR